MLMPERYGAKTGANSCAAGHNAVYTVEQQLLDYRSRFSSNLDIADGPRGALEVNGNVLVMTSPGIYQTGAVFFEWNGSTLTQVAGPPNGPEDSSYYGHMLMLPTGRFCSPTSATMSTVHLCRQPIHRLDSDRPVACDHVQQGSDVHDQRIQLQPCIPRRRLR